jgi:hypothetical protein
MFVQPLRISTVIMGVVGAVACSSGGDVATTNQATTLAPGLGSNQATGLGNPGKGSPGFNGKKANYCGAGGCACSNGIDDDGDGLIDANDPECVGDMDNDEATFATGMPGDNRDPKWQDCFFDGNSGAGDDRCRYPTGCLTGEIPQTDAACAIAPYCIEHCGALTPRNCDCFGCCTVPNGTSTVDVLLTKSCTGAKLSDPTACTRCVKSTNCGPPANDGGAPPPPPPPPPGTEPPPPTSTCAGGGPVCSLDMACPMGFACVNGCCTSNVR